MTSEILHTGAQINHNANTVTFIPPSSDMSDLFGDGFAVQFVVHFPDLGHCERGHREGVETEGHFLLWHQRHRRGRCHLCLRVFTWDNKKRDGMYKDKEGLKKVDRGEEGKVIKGQKVEREKVLKDSKGDAREDGRLKEKSDT